MAGMRRRALPAWPPAVAALLLGAGLLAAGCHRGTTSEAAGAGDAVPVTIRTLRAETLHDSVTAPGTVVPSSAGDWTITGNEPSEIAELPKKEGDQVAVGDLLVRFEVASFSQELAARQVAVLNATTRLDRAKAEVARQSDLSSRGLTPRNAYDAARNEQTAAEGALGEAKAQFDLTNVLGNQLTVKARFSGVVAKVWHAQGDTVTGTAADPVMRVIDPTHVQVLADVSQTDLAHVYPGQAATIRAAGSDGEPASVLVKTPPKDPSATTGQLRLGFAKPSTLPIDTPVTIEITLDDRPNVILVPTSCVLREGAAPYVMVAGDDNRAHHRDVRTGLTTRDYTQVTAGLSAGERVIVGGVTDVVDGGVITLTQ